MLRQRLLILRQTVEAAKLRQCEAEQSSCRSFTLRSIENLIHVLDKTKQKKQTFIRLLKITWATIAFVKDGSFVAIKPMFEMRSKCRLNPTVKGLKSSKLQSKTEWLKPRQLRARRSPRLWSSQSRWEEPVCSGTCTAGRRWCPHSPACSTRPGTAQSSSPLNTNRRQTDVERNASLRSGGKEEALAATLTGVKHWLAFGDDLSKVRLFPLFPHLWHVGFLHLLPLLFTLLGGRRLARVVIGVHLF